MAVIVYGFPQQERESTKGRVGVEGKVVRTVSEHLPKVSSLSCHTLLLKVYFENTLSFPLPFVWFFY